MLFVLPEIPVFQNLSKDQIGELNGWLQNKDYEAGTTIFKEGEKAKGLLVLAKGGVQVVKHTSGGPLVVADLAAPSVIGEIGLLSEETRSASVRADSKVSAGFLPKTFFDEKLREHNITALLIALNLGRIACNRLRATTRRLVEVSEDCTRHAMHAASGFEPSQME